MDHSSEKNSSNNGAAQVPEPPSDQSKSPSADEKIEKLKIVLDNEKNTYHSGQTIRGTISINCTKNIKIRGIGYRVYGYGRCSWIGSEASSGDGKTEKSIAFANYAGKEEYLDTTVYVVGSKNGQPFPLFKGTTNYDFSFDLKPELPSTFVGECGKIKYKLDVIVSKAWSFDEKQTIALNIIQTVNLNCVPAMLQSYQYQQTRNIGGLKPLPLSLHVSLPKRGFIFGDTIPVQVQVINKSKVNVEKLKFGIYQIVEYHSKTPKMAIKVTTNRLLKKDMDGVDKKSEQRVEHIFDVPAVPPTQGPTTSQIIHIKYELKVEAKLGTFHKNLSVTVPITIGSVPYSSNQDEVIFRTHGNTSAQQHSDISRQSVFSNWSVDLQNNLNRSSIVPTVAMYPVLPMPLPGAPPTGFHSVSPIPNSAYQPTSRTSIISNASFGSVAGYNPYPSPPYSPTSSAHTSAIASPAYNPYYAAQSMNTPREEYRASAPPMDFGNTSTPIRSGSFPADRPPSYDEVFARQFNQLNMTCPLPLSDIPKKS